MQPSSHRADFIQAMRHVPGAVAIIACALGHDRTGLAATAWNSVTADPPMLLACVNRTASAHALIVQAAAFSVNVVPASGAEVVAIFSAQRGLSGKDRFIAGNWTTGRLGQPLLKNAAAAFECALEAEHAYCTHSIFIGRIDAVLQNVPSDALLYVDGGYATARAL